MIKITVSLINISAFHWIVPLWNVVYKISTPYCLPKNKIELIDSTSEIFNGQKRRTSNWQGVSIWINARESKFQNRVISLSFCSSQKLLMFQSENNAILYTTGCISIPKISAYTLYPISLQYLLKDTYGTCYKTENANVNLQHLHYRPPEGGRLYDMKVVSGYAFLRTYYV